MLQDVVRSDSTNVLVSGNVNVYIDIVIFIGKFCPRGKGAMRSTLCEAPTRERKPEHYTGNSVSSSLDDKCVRSITSPADHAKLKMKETEPTVYSPYQRKLERPTICRCNLKGSILSYSV